MNIEDYRTYCLSKPGTTEETPFDENTLVFKVMGKMFALTDIMNFESVNLKCDPEVAIELREKYDGLVLPGYHMNKKHWNTVVMNAGLSDDLVKEWIDQSYDLVVSKMPQRQQKQLRELT